MDEKTWIAICDLHLDWCSDDCGGCVGSDIEAVCRGGFAGGLESLKPRIEHLEEQLISLGKEKRRFRQENEALQFSVVNRLNKELKEKILGLEATVIQYQGSEGELEAKIEEFRDQIKELEAKPETNGRKEGCPFCGGTDCLGYSNDYEGNPATKKFRVICGFCETEGPPRETCEKANDAWEIRTDYA